MITLLFIIILFVLFPFNILNAPLEIFLNIVINIIFAGLVQKKHTV